MEVSACVGLPYLERYDAYMNKVGNNISEVKSVYLHIWDKGRRNSVDVHSMHYHLTTS